MGICKWRQANTSHKLTKKKKKRIRYKQYSFPVPLHRQARWIILLLHKAMDLQVWPAASAWTSLGTWQKGKLWGPAPDLLNQDLCALTRSLSRWHWCTCKLWEPLSRQIRQTSALSLDKGFSNSALMTLGAGQSFPWGTVLSVTGCSTSSTH